MWVCLYISVFFFFFLEQVYLCVDLSVWMCLCAFEEKEEDEKLLNLLSLEKREKKRSKREISKIING